MQRVARQVALSRPNGLGSASRLQHLLPQKVSSRAVRGFHARSSPLRAQTDPTYTNATAKPQIIALPPKRSRLRKWIVRFARTTLFVVLGTTGYVLVRSYQQRHPGDQLDHEEGKRNLVVLGNGWASTAFLKSLDTTEYNVTVISPRNYFTFTPLLPSCSVGTIENRSIMEPTRFITRHKARKVNVYEGNATQVDPIAKTVTFLDHSEIKGDTTETTVSYDDLVYAVGAESNTFGIPGVKEHACFLKEVWDTTKIRRRLMECIEGATFKDQSESEIDRLLHMVVVGGGPTGVEYAAELHDFLTDDLSQWYPDIAKRVKITLVEALPSVLPMFSKQLIEYTNSTFHHNHINVMTRTSVKNVGPKNITATDGDKKEFEMPYGLLVWATGNTARSITKKLMNDLGEPQKGKRGLAVDDQMRVQGAENIWALGDCTQTAYSPTAQVAAQQGRYLARFFNQEGKRLRIEGALATPEAQHDPERIQKLQTELGKATKVLPFHYTHQGTLAYVGADKAIADLPFGKSNFASGGFLTFLFWRSAYLSELFSLRNRCLVIGDWAKSYFLGRDVSRES